MNNIFENAYFGKPYKTRDDRKAIFKFFVPNTDMVRVSVMESNNNEWDYNLFLDGTSTDKELKEQQKQWDIVSEWKEQTNDEQHANELLYAIQSTARRTRREVVNKATKWLSQNIEDCIFYDMSIEEILTKFKEAMEE